MRIALDIGGQRVARPFSMVNAPQDPVLEFYGIVVPEGPLSPRLARLAPGERLYVAANPAGFLVLSELPDAETLWLLSTGTGIAPFISMLRNGAAWQRFRNVVLVHAVRHGRELVYQEDLHKTRMNLHASTIQGRQPGRHAGALRGRIPRWWGEGRLEVGSWPQACSGSLTGDAMREPRHAGHHVVLTARGMRRNARPHRPHHRGEFL